MKLTKRLLCLLLAMVLLIGILPINALAAEDAASSAASPPGTEAAENPPPEITEEALLEEATSTETGLEATPAVTTAEETILPETFPTETVLEETISPETTPETSPAETIPQETTLVETASPETAPAVTTPVETAPEETIPPETSPAETTVEETIPAEDAPANGLLPDNALDAPDAKANELLYTGNLSLFQRAVVDFNGKSIWVDGKTKDHLYILGLRDEAIQWYKNQNGHDYHAYPYEDAAGQVVYCIEPGVEIGFDGYKSETVTMDDVWKPLTREQRNTIGLILLYGAPNMPAAGSNEKERFPNEIINEFVTAIMIHEVIYGWRDTTPPYQHNNKNPYNYYTEILGYGSLKFSSNLTGHNAGLPNGEYISMYNEYIPAERVRKAYDYLETKLAQHDAYPSFTNYERWVAPTHTMVKQADGSYTITLTDTSAQGAVKNGLYNWTALAGSLKAKGVTLTVNKSAGQVTITAPSFAAIPRELLTVLRDDIPNPAASSYLVWHSKIAGGQTVMQLKDGKYDPVPAYFKLKGDGSYIDLRKTTTDGKNLAGWQFRVYGDEACTQALTDVLTTDAQGHILGIAVPAQTVYVKELGHADPAIDAMYVCEGSAVQKIDATTPGSYYGVSFVNKLNQGRIEIRKETNTGADLAGWVFHVYTDADCTAEVDGSPFVTDETGIIARDLLPGTYYVTEEDKGDPSWLCDGEVKEVTVTAGETASVSFTNSKLGRIEIRKHTNTGADLGGWIFGVYGADETLVDTLTTDEAGAATSKWLLPGDYTVKEIGSVDGKFSDRLWIVDADTETVTVTAGSEAAVRFDNLHTGELEIRKETNTGADLAGWVFHIFTDADCTAEVDGSPFVTDESGMITKDLLPGTYYVAEEDKNDLSWLCDGEVKKVTVEAGKTVSVTFSNQKLGRIEVHKRTNTGADLDGWIFGVYDADEVLVDTITTDATGTGVSKWLLPGNYTVKETGSVDGKFTDPLWTVDTDTETVTVTAGEKCGVQFDNTHYGELEIRKETNTGADLGGWVFHVYTDEGCSTEVDGSPFTSDENGKITESLLPGTYYITEEDKNDPSWLCDGEVKEVTVAAGESVSVTFINIRYGEIKIVKAMPDGGSVSGWVFEVCTADGATLVGTYTTGEDGSIVSDFLLPGEYVIKEIIPEDSLYVCETDNPQTITVMGGQITEVHFTNRLKPGEIAIQKTNDMGEPLAGAQFLLKWSADGSTWNPVVYRDAPYVIEGGCTSTGLLDGTLTTGEDGLIVFGGLHPGLIYRVTETKAPNGYSLKKGTVYEGSIPADTLLVSLTVVNKPEPDIPQTGDRGGIFLPLLGMAISAMGLFLMIRKRAFM